jgi:hypothetical protein
MTMQSPRITIQTTLYALAFSLALFLRLLNLGAAPLSETEAGHALRALGVVRPQAAVLTGYPMETTISQPGYTALTAAAFSLLGAENFQARLWPTLAGALLVLLPACFRRELGRRAALIMAFGLAVDPGLVIVSRQAGETMLALAFTLLALGMWHIRRPLLAGLLGGCALLCGTAFLQGAAGLALAWVATRLILRRRASGEEPLSEPPAPAAWRTALLAGAAILLVGSSISALHTQNFAAAFAALPAYLNGWSAPVITQASVMVATLLVFEAFILIFATICSLRWLIRRSKDEVEGPFPLLLPLLWAGINLLLVLLYPARQPADLVWSIVPVWALAAVGLADYLPEERPDVIAWLQAALVFVLAVLFWNTLVATDQIISTPDLPISALRVAILVGLIALGALTTGLVALGWNWESSRNGLVWGLIAAFVIYSTAALWSAAQLRPNQPQELWSQPPGPGQVDLLTSTLRDLSNRNTGIHNELEIVSAVDAASLRWALRDFHNARFAARVPPDEQPAVMIANQDSETPALASAYRGQDFVWRVRPDWTGVLPDDPVTWLTFRKAKLANEYVILWARSDLFPK